MKWVSGVTIAPEGPDECRLLSTPPPSGLKTAEGWLGRQDSNLGMVESKSTALPLGDAPAGGRTIVISPEGRYCGLTPPRYVPAVGRAHCSQAETCGG